MKYKLGLVLAFSTGVLVGGLIIHQRMEDRMNEIIDEEIECLKEYYADRNSFEPEEFVDPDDFEEDTLKDIVSLAKNYKGEEVNIDYTQYSKAETIQEEISRRGLESANEFAEENDDLDQPQKRNIFAAAKPYVVGIQAIDTLENYDNQTLTYYPSADVLVDERGEIVEDSHLLVGEFRDQFGNMSESEDVVYIRNEGISMDFEIIKSQEDYADALMREYEVA